MKQLSELFAIGMTADRAAHIVRRSDVKATKPPATVGKDENGKIVEWYLPNCTLRFARSKKDGIVCYRVTQIG